MIRRVSLPPLLNSRKHRVANEISVALRIIFVFGRDGVRTEERDGKVERTFIFKRNQGFEQAQLSCRLQTITGLGFGGGGAVCEHAKQTRTSLRDERLDGSRTRLSDCRDDPATRRE